jgi:hypothetical protein
MIVVDPLHIAPSIHHDHENDAAAVRDATGIADPPGEYLAVAWPGGRARRRAS